MDSLKSAILILAILSIKRCEGKFDVCKLPKDIGPCKGTFGRYYFDRSKGKCQIFEYGGCKGNDNNFLSLADCQEECLDVCVLPKVVGPCEAAIQRYFFNVVTGSCEMFLYGGCLGNGNNFDSEDECQQRCPEDVCKIPSELGPCKDYSVRWYHDEYEERCRPFIYGGCGGSRNNFMDKDKCEMQCPVTSKGSGRCTMPKDTGSGERALDRYHYDVKKKKCRYFEYGGHGGNENNFKTERECKLTCPVESVCVSPKDPGSCGVGVVAGRHQRWYYDITKQQCETFLYSGCGGNGNNYYTKRECQNECNGCSQEKAPGVCNGFFRRWFYNSASTRCENFIFGGCDANMNNFKDKRECEKSCD